MVKVESSLFSEVRGTLNKSKTTFQTRKTTLVMEKKPIPPPEPKGKRECIRYFYKALCDRWHTLTEEEKEQYSETAEKYSITLFNAYLKEELPKILWKCKLMKMDGQVLYFPFLEGSGTTLKDHSGYDNNGTIYGATWVSGKFGYALSFDGVNDYVEIPHSTSLDLNVLSVVTWFKSTYSGEWFRPIITKYGYTTITPFWGMGWMDTNKLGFTIRDYNGVADYSSAQTYEGLDGKWHFLAGVASNSAVQFWMDGVLKSSVSRTAGDIRNTRPVTFARILNLYVPETLSLTMIFNRPLSSEEITQIHELTKPYFE